MPELSELSTISTWGVAIAATLRKLDIAPEPLFDQAGLDRKLLADHNARLPVNGMTKLWQLAVAETGDEAFALKVATNVQPSSLHGLGLAVITSETLGDAVNRLIRYSRIVSDAAIVSCNDDAEDDVYIEYLPVAEGLAPQAFEAFIASGVQLVRGAMQQTVAPVKIEFASQLPVNVDVYEQWFGCSVAFEKPANRLYLQKADLAKALPFGNPALATANDQVINDYLASFDKENPIYLVRQVLVGMLLDGLPTIEAVAKKLNLSVRSLQRQLETQSVTFSELREGVRSELAKNWVKERGKSLTEIAYRLGFSDQSSFSKAFVRWAGVTPSQFRKNAS